MDEYHQYAGVAKTIGVNVKFLKPEQVKDIWPLCNIEGLVGAIQHPEDGYIQPADVTQALATGARNRGAEIYRNTVVTSIKQNKDGWVVITDKGDISCEHIVACSGKFCSTNWEDGRFRNSSYSGSASIYCYRTSSRNSKKKKRRQARNGSSKRQ